MNIPNSITLLRLLSVPVIIYLILLNYFEIAFIVFIISAVSDGIDGFIAKKFNQKTELGAILDPIADKALLIGVFTVLTYKSEISTWLLILVISRDIFIFGGIFIANMLENPIDIKPLMISKITTTLQIILAGLVLFKINYNGFIPDISVEIFQIIVGVFTILSGFYYFREWRNHISDEKIGN